MKPLRWAAVAATVLMSLMNLPVAIDNNEDVATPLAVLISVVGVLGLVAAYGLARRLPWGRPAVIGLGAANVAGAVLALVNDWDGAAVGLVVAGLMLVLGILADRRPTPAPALG